MTLLIYHHPGERKQTRIPKGFGEIPKAFLSPSGYPNHHLYDAVGAIRSTHTVKATFKCSTSENKFPRKQTPDIEIPAHQYKTVCIPVKIRNKFQSQSNHDSFNCRPSKSNPHSINQKSVIFGMHKNTSSECLQHKCHIAP